MKSLLILGGTTEAARLAATLVAGGEIDVLTSLAGRTSRPAALPGRVRVGGFGGSDGLAAWLEAHRPAAVIDATHPYAVRIKANADAAARAAGTPLLHLLRPAWSAADRDRWHDVDDLEAAAHAIRAEAPRHGRVFLTVGRQDLAPFAALAGVPLLVRSIEPPDPGLLPPSAEVIAAAGPFDEAGEIALMTRYDVQTLVSKNAGGAATVAKIAAARALGLPVIMVRRPPPPRGEIVDTVEGAVAWIERVLRRESDIQPHRITS